MKRTLLTLLVAAIAAAAPAGGLAGGGGTLTVDPSPLTSVTLGCTFTVSGSGYTAATSISFEVTGPRKADQVIHYFTGAEPVASDGSFTETWTAWWSVAGAYQLTSFWRDSKGASHKGAVVKFTAVPAAPCA